MTPIFSQPVIEVLLKKADMMLTVIAKRLAE